MKKVYSLLTMAVIAAVSLTLTSCDSDDYWNGHYGWNDPMVGTTIMMIGDGATMIGIMVGKEVRRIVTLLIWHGCSQVNGMDQ